MLQSEKIQIGESSMAKWHYAITAKKRANIVEESSATQKVSISGATEIIE